MPHQSFKLAPGVDTTRTMAANEAAISSSNLIRFQPDLGGNAYVQKLGGWTKYFPTAINDTIRVLWPWQDLNAIKYLGIGAETSLQVIEDASSLKNISPQNYTIDVPVSFTTVAGSSIVIVNDVGSNPANNSVLIETPIAVGGLVLSGLYQCTFVSNDQYTIQSIDVLGNPLPAISSVTTGGAVPSFTTSVGTSPITITLANHGYSVDSDFTVLVPTTVGGITVYGDYTVTEVTDVDNFKINGSNTASSTSTVDENGGNARFIYYVGVGPAPLETGYGVGGYGVGGYGSGTPGGTSRTFVPTSASAVGTTATVTFSALCTVTIGSIIVIAGMTPSGFNGTWRVSASSLGSVSFTTLTVLSGPMTVAGTLVVNNWSSLSSPNDWSLDNWGQDLIANRQGEPIYTWSPTSGFPIATILPNSPVVNEGAFVAMPQRQIIAYGSSFTGIQDPLLVRWCDVQNYSSWIGTVTNQAGSYRIPKGSKIVGGIQAPQQSLIWTDIDLWAMQYIGQPYVYSFNEVGTGCGLIDHKAVTLLNGAAYWMSQSQFFMYSSNGVAPILCPVWDVVFQNIDTNHLNEIRAGANSRFGEVTWYFPTVGSNGVPTMYVKYNVELQLWDYGKLTRTAWVDQSVLGAPIGSDDNGFIFQHETSPDADGQPMPSSFQTGYFTISGPNFQAGDYSTSDADKLMFIDEFWPDMKWGYYGQTQNANIQFTFYAANFPGDTPTVYGPYTVTQATQYFTTRIRTRLLSIKVSSNDIGSFWRLGVPRYRIQEDGRY